MITVNSSTFKQDVKYELVKLGITQREMSHDLGFTEPYLSNILSFMRGPRTKTYREKIVEYIERKKGDISLLESRCVVNGK